MKPENDEVDEEENYCHESEERGVEYPQSATFEQAPHVTTGRTPVGNKYNKYISIKN